MQVVKEKIYPLRFPDGTEMDHTKLSAELMMMSTEDAHKRVRSDASTERITCYP